MISLSNRKRIFNVGLIISILIFLIVIIVIFFKEHDQLVPYQSELLKNVVNLSDVDLLYVIDNTTYVSLKSKSGRANIKTHNFELQNISLKYSRKDYNIDASAEHGIYTEQRYIKAYDNVTGYMDNMTFVSGKNGILEYDYKDGTGIVTNGVVVTQGLNSITSDSLSFDVNNNYIFFKDNVTVNYKPEQ